MSYDNANQMILKKVKSDNPKAPKLRAEITVNGVKLKCGLWPWTRKDGSPVLDKEGNGQYIGQIEEDNYTPTVNANGMAQAKAAAEPDPFQDDTIPF